jgi:hypothetical protein
MSDASTPDQALAQMLAALRSDDLLEDLPGASVSVMSVGERSLALGNLRGTERREPTTMIPLKGGRLDAVVRFAFQAGAQADVETATETLQGRMLAARDALWREGFLRTVAQGAGPAERVPPSGPWRQSIEYQVLYEFHYHELDAESLIARIPIDIDSVYGESLLVTDEMVRWDNLSASELVVRGPILLRGWSALSYVTLPAPSGAVTVTRTWSGATGAPAVYPNWPAFQAAISDDTAPDRHAQVALASLPDLLSHFTASGDALELGDWDEDSLPDHYSPASLVFIPPVRLDRGEWVRLAYAEAALDTTAVIYLRARVSGV